MTLASLSGDAYRLEAARQCSAPDLLIDELRRRSGNRSVLLGFDFPLGLPRVLTHALGVTCFREVLSRLADGEWPEFLVPADVIGQVGPRRPFFPARQLPKGQVSRQALAEALGAATYEEILRRCDRASVERRATACLFFLVGGQQVGKAAIDGWRGLILTHHNDPGVALWPFDGSLGQLVAPGRTVLCETYPGEFTRPLGLAIGSGGRSKRRQSDRRAQATMLLRRAIQLDLVLDPALRRQIDDGFGAGVFGEDAFDSLVGLLGMLSVAAGRLAEGVPAGDPGLAMEGWILGHRG